MWGRGRIDHFGLHAASPEAFATICQRLVEHHASDAPPTRDLEKGGEAVPCAAASPITRFGSDRFVSYVPRMGARALRFR